MKATYLATTGGLALALALSGTAMAAGGQATGSQQYQGTGGGTSFNQLDQNKDGYLSQTELRGAQGAQGLSQNWSQMDRDGDGRIDQSEFSAFESQSGGSMGQGRQQGYGSGGMGGSGSTGGGMGGGSGGSGGGM